MTEEEGGGWKTGLWLTADIWQAVIQRCSSLGATLAVVPVLGQYIGIQCFCDCSLPRSWSLVFREGYLLTVVHARSISRTCESYQTLRFKLPCSRSNSEAMSSQHMASANCPPTPCRYVASDNTPCSTYITCTTAAGHFRSAHGVELSSPDATLQCGWQGCGNTIERRNLVRHVQGAHLQHGRGGAHA